MEEIKISFVKDPSEFRHDPVMLHEVIEAFEQISIEKPKNYLDGTFGRGGHSLEISRRFPGLVIHALDKDHQAIDHAELVWREKIKSRRFFIEQTGFSYLNEVIERKDWPLCYDMILLDMGVSSPQVDESSRGFSFYKSGVLDMRMDQRASLTAGEIVNEWSEEKLIGLFRNYGEIHKPQNAVKRILRERKKAAITSTGELSRVIAEAVGWKKKGKHPATRYFLALRLVVNRELEDLKEGLEVLIPRLSLGGRLVVITFHSLEDRIVKHFFKNTDYGQPVNKKVIKPTRGEQLKNRRSRSARLRIFQRTEKTERMKGMDRGAVST